MMNRLLTTLHTCLLPTYHYHFISWAAYLCSISFTNGNSAFYAAYLTLRKRTLIHMGILSGMIGMIWCSYEAHIWLWKRQGIKRNIYWLNNHFKIWFPNEYSWFKSTAVPHSKGINIYSVGFKKVSIASGHILVRQKAITRPNNDNGISDMGHSLGYFA